MDKDTQHYIEWFRHSTPYINNHRNKTFVIWLGGEAVAHDNFPNIVHDLNLLSSLGIKLLVVHGSRPQIDQELEQLKLSAKYHKQLRVTDQASLDAVCKASAQVRTKIESQLSMGLANSPMHGAKIKVSSGNYVSAKPIGVIDGIDHEHTGEVRSVNTQAIQELLDANHIVLLSNLAYSSTGDIFNLNSEHVAKACAIALQADKLIYFSEQEGLLDTSKQLIRELNTQHELEHIDSDQLHLFKAASEACEQGVKRSHIVSHILDGALIEELFTRDGSGSLISEGAYEALRQATIEDVQGILELISPLEDAGVLVKRSREALENEIDCFNVVERDGHVVACAALYVYEEQSMAELACICVHPNYQKGERGELLLSFIEKQAQFLGIESLFVLTTQTAHWFLERGFESAELDSLPMEKQGLYNYQRNSKIFQKSIK